MNLKKKKKQRLLERNDKGQGKKCDHWNQNLKITVGKKNYRWNHAKFEKKEASWKKNNKKILKNNILIKQ